MNERSTPGTDAFAISEATLFGLPGEIIARGWTASPDLVTSVRIRIDGQLIGATALNAARPDIAAKLGQPVTPFHGFQFQGRASQTIAAGQAVEVIFMSRDGKPLETLTRRIEQRDRLDAVEADYDFDSRQLRLKGCLFPARQLRSMAVVFARGTSHDIRHLFEHRPEDCARDPEKRALYSGFRDRISFVGEGDVRNAQLRLEFTDGSHRLWSFPPDLIRFNSPEAAIETVAFDWVNARMEIKGWYRSYTPVTGLDLRLNGQTVHGFPIFAPSDRIQKALGFRGVMAQEFSISGPLDFLLTDPDAVFLGDVTGELRLRSREDTLMEESFPRLTVRRNWAKITLAQFDRRNNVLQIDGTIAGPLTPALGQLILNGRRIDAPLPLQVNLVGGKGDFSWTHEINGVLPPTGEIALELFDTAGTVVGSVAHPAAQCMTVSRHGAVDGHAEAALAKKLLESYAALPAVPEPSVCFVLQGAATGVGSGGGVRRLTDLMESFHDVGYTTILIDRSDPWNLLKWPDEYRRLRRICDRHLMIPQSAKRHMTGLLAEMVEQGSFKTPKNFKIDGKTIPELLRMPPKKLGNDGLMARVDPEFNILAATLANGLAPKVVISSYAWSGPLHDLLHPSIHGMIDTIDVQSLRATIFAEAQAILGPEAVPDQEKFAVSVDEEIGFLSSAQSLITINRSEQDFLCGYISPAKVVYAGVSARGENSLPHSDPTRRRVLFVGNLYEPNVDGANLLLRQIWPAVLERIPDAVLTLCGRVCSGLTDPALPSVEFLGPVEDLVSQYAAATLTLNPIRFGTGVSVKLVETLTMGRCIVSTPVGARGFEEAARSGALEIAELDDFAAAICRLLEDPAQRHAMEAAARSFAQEALSPSVVHSDLFNLIESKLYY